MEFFNEIWLKVGKHKYIYIFEIKFEKKKIFRLKMEAKTSFVTLRDIANLCSWKWRNRYDFFFHQKMRNCRQLQKRGRKNLYPFKQEARKTKCFVQVDPPYTLKC